MADEITRGLAAFTEQPQRVEFQAGAWWQVRRWEGPQSLLDDFLPEVIDLNPTRITRINGVPAIVEAWTEWEDAPVDPVVAAEDNAVWEMIGQDLDKPIETHGYWNRSGVTVSSLEAANDAIRRGTAGAIDWDTLYPALEVQAFVNHKLRGIDTYDTFAYICRKTIQFSKDTAIELEFEGVTNIPGKVLTWAQLVAIIPASAKFKQPKVHVYDPVAATWTDKPLNEWLIKAPTLRWEKSTKLWELTREYWGAEKWSSVLYDGGTYVP